MRSFITAPWTNGRPNHHTGAGFGVRIPVAAREAIFKKQWSHVVLNLDGALIDVPITPTFWGMCAEIRSKHIGQWLIKHGHNRWRRGFPPTIEVTHEGNNVFSLLLT